MLSFHLLFIYSCVNVTFLTPRFSVFFFTFALLHFFNDVKPIVIDIRHWLILPSPGWRCLLYLHQDFPVAASWGSVAAKYLKYSIAQQERNRKSVEECGVKFRKSLTSRSSPGFLKYYVCYVLVWFNGASLQTCFNALFPDLFNLCSSVFKSYNCVIAV